ncbi:MAG TPA: 4-(cytidine 5'-diphospho)-2-C-methyl-D-erythritol kinase [Candidatus Polarisedimenticolia bacterium]|jgi:4-diphosphocytidyl-2-C-methyl-D-erythritol kinase
MQRLEVSSFAKVNLGLKVLGCRADGYHEVRTVLQTIDLADHLSFEQAPELSMRVEGTYRVAGDESNLVMRAARALSERFPGHGARILLRKSIPPGAGLGGGSSNAAATLLALGRLWGLDADPGLLYALARGLGSDVPFFLYGGTCLGLGRGDEIFPLPDPPERSLIVAWPGVELSTAAVYAGLPLALTSRRILSSMKGFLPGTPVRASRDEAMSPAGGPAGAGPAAMESPGGGNPSPPAVENDLEETAFGMLPALRRLKDRLVDSGAVAAAMSGSGSAVFGMFPSSKGIDKLAGSLATGETVTFVCRTLSRDAYRVKLFQRTPV